MIVVYLFKISILNFMFIDQKNRVNFAAKIKSQKLILKMILKN